MGDSDDEHERSRSRDKFRRERNDYGSGEKGRSSRNDSAYSYRDKRSSWRDDRRRSREDYEDDGRHRYSSGSGYTRGHGGREWSPPSSKRMRKDWDSLHDFGGPGMMNPYGIRPPWMPQGPHPQVPPMLPGLPRESPNSTPQGSTRHMILTFKQFLSRQDDSVDEVNAITRYNDYKSEFKKKQMEEFFDKHKDEDWFLSLYHPTKLEAARERSTLHLKSRVEAFVYLLEVGLLEKVSLAQNYSDLVIKIMDTAIIIMEGGTDNDLLSLEEDKKEERERGDAPVNGSEEPSTENLELAEKAKLYGISKEKEKKILKSSEENDENETSALEEDNPEGDPLVKEDEEEESSPPGTSPPPESTADLSNLVEDGTHQEEEKVDGTRPLHLTPSVYIKRIPPKLSSEDISEVCKGIPGFLRITFDKPSPEKGYERRGWVTFSHKTDIKDVCDKLSALKVKDCLLTCNVNRDLVRRVKYAIPASWTRRAVHSDLQNAIKLIRFFDEKIQLWEYSLDEDKKNNPVLSFDEDVLLEDEDPVAMTTGEDEEGAINDSSTDILKETDNKMKVLEKLLWYLRVVHSLDYYSTSVNPTEDNMPNRCGIFTVRRKVEQPITPEQVTKYCEEMESKVDPLLAKKKYLSDSDIEKFGKKDPETEAEKFIESNIQKVSDNKYLCPLSGKKFKGPEFVRKHIHNKHLDKVEGARKKAEFFNNYIRDPERPMPLEPSIKSSVLPPNPKTPSSEESPTLAVISPLGGPPTTVWGGGQDMMMFRSGPGPYGGAGRMGGYPPRSRSGRGRRRQVTYFDLDAPEEDY